MGVTAAPRVMPCWADAQGEVESWYGPRSREAMLFRVVDGWHATCVLPRGHDGPHVWSPDREVA